ncbi:Sec-independent protein translocase protein TatB [Henriciella aquimarina]|uniref:Sec-independent protein translocase protein TatB n=1 Tax=Henriciella aquimarina TaxID=545261 RepID=UPI0009FFA74B|nr:Sec-independent protein translocase protein TatB [Henriciella aquimarina]
MLPQFGFTEFLVVAIIALIVVGPKDLPMMMRKLGQFVSRGKAMAREFQSAFDDIARQAELDELRKEIEDLRRDNALSQAVDDLKKTESDINRKVMMENPMPETGPQGGPGAVPDHETPSENTDTPPPAEKPAASGDAPETESGSDTTPEKKAQSS